MKRILIIAPQWIGDAVMSQPLVAALAARGNTLVVAALPWVAPIYRAMPGVSGVLNLPFAHGRLDLRLRYRLGRDWQGRFDTAVVLPNSLKAALLPFFAGIPERVGYVGEARRALLTASLPNPNGRPPMVAFYRALAARVLGTSADAPLSVAAPRPALLVPPERVAAVLDRQGLMAGRYWVFAPGAEYGPAKCWPAEHYAQLAVQLASSRAGADAGNDDAAHPGPVLLLGSAKEAALTRGIAAEAARAGADCRDLAGLTSLDDAIALISASGGMVSNDSGLMHVAAAFGVAQVAVFGSTSPEHTPPLNDRARVLWLKDELKLDCAPCFERSCRFGHLRCLTGIAPARVQSALAEALATPAAGGCVKLKAHVKSDP